MTWSNPHHGVSHYGDRPTHATVSVWDRFTEWFVYSWLSHRVVREGVERGPGHEARAKAIAARIVNAG